MWYSNNKKSVLLIFMALLIIGVGALWYSRSVQQSVVTPPPSFEPYHATLTGTYLCLPHTDTSGPQTMECALGLQAEDGAYYALDFNQFSTIPPSTPTGARVKAAGTVTPVENLSSDHWRKYPIKGILTVTDSFDVN